MAATILFYILKLYDNNNYTLFNQITWQQQIYFNSLYYTAVTILIYLHYFLSFLMLCQIIYQIINENAHCETKIRSNSNIITS